MPGVVTGLVLVFMLMFSSLPGLPARHGANNHLRD